MKYVMPTRRELGFRTFFNILGPMVNPAGVQRYVIGAFNKEVAEKMVHILANLDTDFAYTFNAHDGLDEVSLTSQSEIFELKDKVVSTSIIFDPESIGFKKVEMDALMGGGKEENARILKNIMSGEATEAQQNIALLNATFAIQASGKVDKLEEAKELAVDALESGKARKMLNDFVDATNDAMGTFKY
jgi:anthranilate phosphoribosyltransferase